MVDGLFEVHLMVADLERSIDFYRDVLGLELAHVTLTHDAAFFWIGGSGGAMLGLWTAGPAPHRLTLHTAFRVSLPALVASLASLGEAGVTPLDFYGRPASEPVVIGWMPAAAVYFRDPDGHLLEYVAMLPEAPRPELGVVPLSAWRSSAGQARHCHTGDSLRPKR